MVGCLEAGMPAEDNDRKIMSFMTLCLTILLGACLQIRPCCPEHRPWLHICRYEPRRCCNRDARKPPHTQLHRWVSSRMMLAMKRIRRWQWTEGCLLLLLLLLLLLQLSSSPLNRIKLPIYIQNESIRIANRIALYGRTCGMSLENAVACPWPAQDHTRRLLGATALAPLCYRQ